MAGELVPEARGGESVGGGAKAAIGDDAGYVAVRGNY